MSAMVPLARRAQTAAAKVEDVEVEALGDFVDAEQVTRFGERDVDAGDEFVVGEDVLLVAGVEVVDVGPGGCRGRR